MLRARATRAHKFDRWAVNRWPSEEPGCQRAPTCALTLDGDKRIDAQLSPTATLIATAVGSGTLVLDPPEAGRPARVCAGPITEQHERQCVQRYPNGTRVTITATADTAVPGARFVGWSDYRCDRRPSCTLPMRGMHYLTATFQPALLKVVEGTFGAITFSPRSTPCVFRPDPTEPRGRSSCTIPYPLHGVVTLRHRSRAHQMDRWGGACDNSDLTCSVRMDTNRWVLAGMPSGSSAGTVTPGEVIWLEYGGPRGGVVSIAPVTGPFRTKRCTRTCSTAKFGHGELVEIRAQPGPGMRFRRWADSRVRLNVRRLRIGTRNPVKAIFERR